jgi:hypothetical protein
MKLYDRTIHLGPNINGSMNDDDATTKNASFAILTLKPHEAEPFFRT